MYLVYVRVYDWHDNTRSLSENFAGDVFKFFIVTIFKKNFQ